MPNRREFLQIGVAATAWPLAGRAVRAAGAALPGRLPIYTVIFDRRYRESIEFAERAANLGLSTTGIEGDMTRVWFDDIDHAWRRRPIAIAGLTAYGPLFCFEQLGRDHGLRVVFRAEHEASGSDGIEHALSGPAPMLDACARLDVAGERWPVLMADAVASCPEGRWKVRSARVGTRLSGDSVDPACEGLHSWIIAPAARASTPA